MSTAVLPVFFRFSGEFHSRFHSTAHIKFHLDDPKEAHELCELLPELFPGNPPHLHPRAKMKTQIHKSASKLPHFASKKVRVLVHGNDIHLVILCDVVSVIENLKCHQQHVRRFPWFTEEILLTQWVCKSIDQILKYWLKAQAVHCWGTTILLLEVFLWQTMRRGSVIVTLK